VQELGLDGISDPDLLQYALTEQWHVLSHDVNTLEGETRRRVTTGDGVFGVFIVLQDASIRFVAESILLIWGASEAEEWVDLVRYLPLKQ
jgi:hypothetical protein